MSRLGPIWLSIIDGHCSWRISPRSKLIKPGTKVDSFAVNVDYAPTILDLAGIDVPADMQGASLRLLFDGSKPADWRTSM